MENEEVACLDPYLQVSYLLDTLARKDASVSYQKTRGSAEFIIGQILGTWGGTMLQPDQRQIAEPFSRPAEEKRVICNIS